MKYIAIQKSSRKLFEHNIVYDDVNDGVTSGKFLLACIRNVCVVHSNLLYLLIASLIYHIVPVNFSTRFEAYVLTLFAKRV